MEDTHDNVSENAQWHLKTFTWNFLQLPFEFALSPALIFI